MAAQTTSGAVAYRGARSGNAQFDPASGRFAAKGTRTLPPGSALVNPNPVPVTRSGIPQGITRDEWERRLDLVRKAARELAAVDANAAQGFLKDRVTDLSRVDIAQFLFDVRAHQIDDLLDAFDAQLRQGQEQCQGRSAGKLGQAHVLKHDRCRVVVIRHTSGRTWVQRKGGRQERRQSREG